MRTASSVIESDDVFDARTTSGRHTLSSSRENARLELEVLGNGFDDEIGVGEIGHRRGGGDPREQGVGVLLGELAPADGPRRGGVEVGEAAGDGVVVDLGGDDVQAVAGEHLDDARAHRAQTDDTDRSEFPRHPVILPDDLGHLV